MKFGNKLKEARKESKMSQSDVAEKLGVKRATVGKWETDDNSPNIETLYKLSTLYNVSADDLLGIPTGLEKHKRTKENVKLLTSFSELNQLGKEEAIKRVSELTIIPVYTSKGPMPIAAHNDAELDENELALMKQDIEEL